VSNDLKCCLGSQDSYERLMFRDALKNGGYDLYIARDLYRMQCGTEGMNRSLVQRFVEVRAGVGHGA
jgi:leucyl-tRNA synthetase